MLSACLLMTSLSTMAQTLPPAPVDKDVRIGKLDNGLTYYIRHNEKPKGQADFYIAQKVGSILEQDNQRGLAHFLEHMCFNGTKNFPGNSLIDWLETVGVKFGYNLNAYTSVDETVYNISNVPVDRTGVQDSCLLILHDWANDLLLDTEEITKERGVIHEEWRRSMSGQMRILENLLPTIFNGNRYGYRLPIGIMDVVDNFEPQALRDYYQTWYRPDQQGIIVVGDIDPEYIEGKIKELFSPIKMPENPLTREYLNVEDNEGTIYAIGKDKEMNRNIVELLFKTDPLLDREATGTVAYFPINFMTTMVSSMLDARLDELAQKADASFAGAGADFGDFFGFAKTKKSFTVSGLAKNNDVRPVLESLYREVLRARNGGFTVSEYERARSEYLSQLEKAYNDRNNVQTANYVRQYVRNFIDNTPIPSIEDKYTLMQQIAQTISVDMINQFLPEVITPDNRVIIAMVTDNDETYYPTKEELAAVMAKVDGETIEAYKDEVKSEPLIAKLPKPGKITKEAHNAQWDATELTLSNGVKVIVKPTKFKDDEILFSATAKGGKSAIDDKYATDIVTLPYFAGQAGLGDYTNSDLTKYLQGKQVSVNSDFDSEYDRSIDGHSTIKDLPTLMELIYMNFTNVTITPEEFATTQKRYYGILKNQENNPQFVFQNGLMKHLLDSPKSQVVSSDDFTNANRDNFLSLVKQYTANAADYLFVFVGNVDLETLRPLLEQYIATLPANAKKLTNNIKLDPTVELKGANTNDNDVTKMETPQTWTFVGAQAAVPYTAKNSFAASIAGQVLTKRLIKNVREDMGATYSISASMSLSRNGIYNATLQCAFPMKPEMKQQVLDYIKSEIQSMTGNVTDDEVNAIKEFMIKTAKENRELNSPWLNAITSTSLNGVDTFSGNIEAISAITPADVQAFMSQFLKDGFYHVYTLDPETAE